jgi:hypothetical protein
LLGLCLVWAWVLAYHLEEICGGGCVVGGSGGLPLFVDGEAWNMEMGFYCFVPMDGIMEVQGCLVIPNDRVVIRFSG